MSENWRRTRLDHRTRQSDAIAGAALSLLHEQGAAALSMAAVATAAGVSRQTLYRYYDDIDAVLVGVARLIADHDDRFAAQVGEVDDPVERLDAIVRRVARAGDHESTASSLRSTLPPDARDVLDRHEQGIAGLVSDVLHAGMERGDFRDDLDLAADARLLLGLAAAAGPAGVERAVLLVHRMVDNDQKEEPT